MQYLKQQRALRFSRASLLIGISIVPIWCLFMVFSCRLNFSVSLEAIMLILPAVISFAGLILGIIGLVQSIRAESRSVKGIVLAVIGIILNLFILGVILYILPQSTLELPAPETTM